MGNASSSSTNEETDYFWEYSATRENETPVALTNENINIREKDSIVLQCHSVQDMEPAKNTEETTRTSNNDENAIQHSTQEYENTANTNYNTIIESRQHTTVESNTITTNSANLVASIIKMQHTTTPDESASCIISNTPVAFTNINNTTITNSNQQDEVSIPSELVAATTSNVDQCNFSTNQCQNMHRQSTTNEATTSFIDTCDIMVDDDRLQHRKELAENLNEFRQEIAMKHEKRRQLIEEKRKEMQTIRDELVSVKLENAELKTKLEKAENTRQIQSSSLVNVVEVERLSRENAELKETMEKMRQDLEESVELVDKNRQMRIDIAEMQTTLQNLNAEVATFEEERQDYKRHVIALKDVIKVSKDLLKIREDQIHELSKKIKEIEEIVKEREAELLSNDLKVEYERQLSNIRNLRALYEDRQRANAREKEKLQEQLDEANRNIETEQNNSKELQERIDSLEDDNSKKYDTIRSLESNLGLSKAESKDLQAEMNVINQLFSQILLSFSSCKEVDLVKLTQVLEENHDLLSEIVVNEVSSQVSSALPKTLLDLVTQVADQQAQSQSEEEKLSKTVEDDAAASSSSSPEKLEVPNKLNSPEEIVENLPKVWKVLIELLSQQTTPPSNVLLGDVEDSDNPCYKSVQTPSGTKLVVNVSQTYIRLKDLILEKKSLEKETMRLKHLNGHLETRLSDQEKRLGMVSSELSKTWHVVGKMQRQHQQLHTQEKILRYELAQKRKLLTELKEELEYCREKWVQARQKNSNTEEQWKLLRSEFASRKRTVDCDSNTSVESGYSDEKSSSDTDEHESEDEKTQNEEDAEENAKKNAEKTQPEEKNNERKNDGVKIKQESEEVSARTDVESKKMLETKEGCSETQTTNEAEKTKEKTSKQSKEDVDEIDHASTNKITTHENDQTPSTSSNNETKLKELSTNPSVDNLDLTTDESNDDNKPLPNQFLDVNAIAKLIEEKTKSLTSHNQVKSDTHNDEEASTSNNVNINTNITQNNAETQKEDSILDVIKTEIANIIEEDANNAISTNTNTSECSIAKVGEKYDNITEKVQVQINAVESNTLTKNDNEKVLPDNVAGSSDAKTDDILMSQVSLESNKVDFVSQAGCSSSSPQREKTHEEKLQAKEERLKRLEEQCKQLVKKVTSTSERSVNISNKLDNLHGIYGERSSSIDLPSSSSSSTSTTQNAAASSSTTVASPPTKKVDEEKLQKETTTDVVEDITQVSNNNEEATSSNSETGGKDSAKN